MNKIKIIYDTVKKMKNRDAVKGTLKVEWLKDQERMIEVGTSFERNGQRFEAKGKTVIESDCDGKKMRLENNIDIMKEGCCEHHHGHRLLHHPDCSHGMKGGFNKLTAALGILSSIKLEEKADGAVLLSLESGSIPEEIKTDINEMMKHCHEGHENMEGRHQHCAFMKELHEMEKKDFSINIQISKDRNIEKIEIRVKGENTDHQLKLSADICLE